MDELRKGVQTQSRTENLIDTSLKNSGSDKENKHYNKTDRD